MSERRRSRTVLWMAVAAAAVIGFGLGFEFRSPEARLAQWVRTSVLDSVAQAQGTAARVPIPASAEFSFADVAEQVTPAVVTVRTEKRGSENTNRNPLGDGFFDRFFDFNMPRGPQLQRGIGSGFIVDAKGVLLTNNHVIDGADKIVVRMNDGREFEGKLVGTDPQTDIAVVEIQAQGLPTVRLGNSDALRVGDWVLAVGSPFGQHLEHTVTAGILSAKGRTTVGLADYEDYLQTDAAINPGNSGGPLVNLHGEVIGINTAIASRSGGSQGVGFAIPINMANRIVEQLRDGGKVTRAWLGVGIQELTPELARGLDISTADGILVNDIFSDGPAARAGFQEGDVILSMNGQPAESVAKFRNRVAASHPGERVRFEILRDGKRREIALELVEKTDAVVASATQPRREVESGLGLELANLTPDVASRFGIEPRSGGIVVVSVQDGSPAAEADLRPGDVLRVVNRRRVANVADFTAALSRLDAADPVVLLVRRGERSFYATVTRTS